MMKKLCMLLCAIQLLFLVSCQQNENVKPESELIGQDNRCGFVKEGDPRDPAEYLSPERIKEIQEIFKKFEGKELTHPVIQIPSTKSAGVFPLGPDSIKIYETSIPLGKAIEGKYIYIDTEITYARHTERFYGNVFYHLGQDGQQLFGFRREGDEIWKSGDEATGIIRRLMFFNCALNIRLKNTPNYNLATVTFTIQMVWDSKPGFADKCEVVVNQRDVKVKYSNEWVGMSLE